MRWIPMAASLAVVVCGVVAWRQSPQTRPAGPLPVPDAPPIASIDLMKPEGVALCDAAWRYSDVKIVEVASNGPPPAGADRNTPGPPMMSYDIEPRAGEEGFDDSKWPILDAATLADRRGAAKISFNWYRINLAMPAKVGDVDLSGTTAVFTITIDDYAEVWVNGKLPRTLTPPNPNLVQGFNQPNRVTISQSVKPGERIQLAVFGINGPISAAPGNYIFVREARVDFIR